MAKRGETAHRRGSRRVALAAVAVVVVLLAAACQDWPQYMGNPALNGVATGVTFMSTSNVGHLTEAWTTPPAGMPVVAGNQLFAASRSGLEAVGTDGVTGCSGSPVRCHPEWTASLAGADRPTVPAVAGGLVYEDFGSTKNFSGTLAAFDVHGVTNCAGSPTVCQPLWTANASTYLGVTVASGVVYVDDINTLELEAFDAAGTTNCSGAPKVCQPLWTASVGSLGVPSVANGRVYVGNNYRGAPWVGVFDATGTTGCSGTPKVCLPLWTVVLPKSTSSSVDVANGVGYVEASGQLGGIAHLVAFDANGTTNCAGSPLVCQPLWTASLGGTEDDNTPAVSGGHVYAPSTSGFGHLDVFDAAGVTNCSGTPVVCTPEWSIAPFVEPFDEGSPIVVNGLVYQGGGIYDAAGSTSCSGSPKVCTPLWTAGSSTEPGNFVFAAIDEDTLFVGETDGFVHAFRIPST